MNRRDFLLTTAAVAALPLAAHASNSWVNYSPGVVAEALAEGRTVFVDFSAHWCSTCAAQERQIGTLRGENPAYGENVLFVKVDWDTYRTAEFTRSLRIPRRSTLVVLKGDQELGRIVAGTSRAQIKDLMDIALEAATA